jgi:hypothetical protein
MVNPYGKRFVELASKYVGVTEEPLGSNRSKLIDQWNTAVGVPVGSFWCASFVSAVVRDFEKLGIDFPLQQSASCDVWLKQAKYNAITSIQPTTGALFLICPSPNDATHIGIVGDKVDGVWHTIEGNSNMGGSRNGYSVVNRPNGIKRNNIIYVNWMNRIEESDNTPWHVVFPNKTIEAVNVSGSTYIPLRAAIVACDGDDSLLTYDGQPLYRGKKIPCKMVVINGRTHVPVREFMNFADLDFDVLSATQTIKVHDDDLPWV